MQSFLQGHAAYKFSSNKNKFMKKKLCCCLFSLLLLTVSSFAQQMRTIKGRVADIKTLAPLTGVTVKAGSLNIFAQTDNEGNFTILIPAGTVSLQFTYVGYSDAELPVKENMVVQMGTSEKTMNEVVVVGYGKATRRNITGSISKLNSKDVANVPAPSFESAMQGKAAGVVIESGSGKVGQGIKIRIRGTSSISANSQPLYVVDGLPISTESLSDGLNEPTNPLADINPNDIESIEVLKDASASAIYGARAANGVVLITTKKGKNNQKTSIELNTSTSFSNPARTWKYVNATEYVDLIHLAAQSDGSYDFKYGISGYATEQDAIDDYTKDYNRNVLNNYSLGTSWQKGEVNTDWQKLLYNHNAPASQVDLSVSGGNEKTKFFASGTYNVQDAIVINNKFYRYGGRLNLEHNATDKLSIGVNMNIVRTQLNRVTNDDEFSTPGQLVAQLPISPLYDPVTGELNNKTLYPNALYDAQYNSDVQVTNHTLAEVFANYSLLPELSFRSEFGADLSSLNQEAFQAKQTIDGSGIGKANIINSISTGYNINNYFTYTPSLGDNHKLNAVAGMSYLQNDSKFASSYGEGTPTDAIKNLNGTTSITFANSTNYKYTFLSYFLRANYSFDDKYLFGASIRTDGSSRFGSNNRYGWFPAFSAGWVVSDEKFMKHIGFINFLKLRASWGITGNAEIGEGNFYSLYSVVNYPGLPGLSPTQLGNKDLKWEKTAQTDAGLEFSVLKSRISVELDYYNKQTSGLLLFVNVPETNGYTSVTKNLGTLENKGFEATINTTNIDGKIFKWTSSINAANNQNKILDIGGQIIEAGFGLTQRAVEGLPIGEFYAQKFVGVDPATGDALYEGEDGKPTADFGAAARLPLGNSNPKWTGGLSNNFTYKNFSLDLFFTFVYGNKLYDAGGEFRQAGFYNGFDNPTINIKDAWTGPGDITNIPRIGYYYGSGYQNSSRFLYDGSYIRFRTASLSYIIPKSFVEKLKISSAKVYVSGENLFTITKYPGDPEVNVETLGNIGGGQDFYTIPQPRTITFGLNVKF